MPHYDLKADLIDAPASGTEEQRPAPPSPEPTIAELRLKFGQLKATAMPNITTAIQANSPSQSEILRLVKTAVEYEKAEAFPNAFQALEEAAKLAAPRPGSAPPRRSPPPRTPPQQQNANSQVVEALSAQWGELTSAIKDALATHPERRDEILRPVATFQAQLKAGQTGAATASLTKIRALLESFGPIGKNGASPQAEKQTNPPAKAVEEPAGAAKKSRDPGMRLVQENKALIARRAVHQNELNAFGDQGGDPGKAARTAAQELLTDPLETSRLKQFPEKLQALRAAIAAEAEKTAGSVDPYMKSQLDLLGEDEALNEARKEYQKAKKKKAKRKEQDMKSALDKFTKRAEALWKTRDEDRQALEERRSSMLVAVGDPLPSGLADADREELERLRGELDPELQATDSKAFSSAKEKFDVYEMLLTAAKNG